MKLAIVCEMPGPSKILSDDIKSVTRFGGGSIIRYNANVVGDPDLSANAEQSAKDAFRYCAGPFSEMEFVRIIAKSVFDKALASSRWILFIGHDCVVDIQSFEVFQKTLDLHTGEKFDLVRFPHWTASGVSGISEKYSFQKSPFLCQWGTVTAQRRILIELED